MKSARIKIVIIAAKYHNGFISKFDYPIDGGTIKLND